MSERLESIESHPRDDDDGRRRCAFSRVSREQTNAPLSPLRARTSLPRASVRRRRQSNSPRRARRGPTVRPFAFFLFRRFRSRSRGVSLGFISPMSHDSSNSPSLRSSPHAHRPGRSVSRLGRSTHSFHVHAFVDRDSSSTGGGRRA